MLNWLLENRIRAAERSYGVPLDYARYMAQHSKAAMIRMARFMRLTHFRSPVPAEALAIAGIAGSLADDCGSCVQIGVNIARQQGVAAQIIRAAVDRDLDDLPDRLRDAYEFALAATSLEGPDDDLRERVRQRYGDRGLIDLSMAVAMHRVYPTLKRALGYANSCSRVTVSA